MLFHTHIQLQQAVYACNLLIAQHIKLKLHKLCKGTRWRSWLRVRFPIISLECFTGVILLAALWSSGRLSLYEIWVPGIFPGG